MNDNKTTGKREGAGARVIPLSEAVKAAGKPFYEKYARMYDFRALAKILGDPDMMQTAQCFFENNLNVSRTAEALYMHRNTLMYRLNKIKKITGLDVKNFDAAVTFQILTVIYGLK